MTPTLCPHNVTTTDLLFHLLSTTPSDDSDRTGDFLYCNETKQVWNDERFFTLQYELAFALKFVCYPKCSCVVQAGDHPDNSSTSTVWSPAPGWVWCSPDCTSFVEMDSRWFGWRSCSKMSATFSRTRLGTSQSSTSSLRSPSTRCSESSLPLQSEWREWYHAILI